MRNLSVFLVTIIASLTLYACVTKNNTSVKQQAVSTDKIVKETITFNNEWKEQANKLNVIYWVPKDVDTVAGYTKRISKILLNFQEYTAIYMAKQGFGRKSFGLDLKHDKEINIITIYANKGKNAYPYRGGGSLINKELTAYFSKNPSKKHSQHSLVILPSVSGDPLNPGGVPFYGLGTFCYALDYPEMKLENLGKFGKLGDLATKWIGGLYHELGHGLNAPHNSEKKSEKTSKGTALMGAGNYSFGKSPTFITGATAATFANSQAFSNKVRSDWYAPTKNKLIQLKGKVENGKIKIAGNFKSDVPVTDIVVYHDPYPAGGNKDYDAPAWNTKPIGIDSLYIENDLSDFFKLKGKYQLRIRFYHENGTQNTYSFEYEFKNGIPNIEIINIKKVISPTNWKIIEVSSQENDGLASAILDGYQSSFWHTAYRNKQPKHPHYFVLDRNETTIIKGFAFGNRANLNGVLKDFSIFGSNTNSNWQKIGDYSLERKQTYQFIELPANTSYRYFKIQTKNSHGDFNYTHLAVLATY
ncbi:discoidin domain-containing protein [Polaribacter ponticola]|uniref:Discoidin domain-containing protein n=1 Tax=Polaribacter ponticola TaxID=2978475 RepID=A0ABT5SCN4_9FLAO|nr:discoidin domain-containing protein [Polaribacter sp. MSW5]MDD7915300.1 discoidin domain-containing protein [Polaribacter sp. MSW5]